jgi:hypothetical protein
MSQVNQIKSFITAKETELAQAKGTLSYYKEQLGYQIAQFEQDIYDLNVRLQLAEADETFYTSEQAAAEDKEVSAILVTSGAFDDQEEPCYHCGRAIHSCLCPSAPTEDEAEPYVEAPAHREGTKLKWVSSTNPETYSVAIVKKDGILEVKRVTDGGGHCHDTTLCQCTPCSEIRLSTRLGVPMPPWLKGAPLLKTFFETETEWRASLPGGGLRGSVKTTVPAISERMLKKLCVKPLTGTTDGLKLKELQERFPDGTLVLTTATEQLEIEHIYYNIAAYPEDWRHQIYSKKYEQAVFDFRNLGDSARANGKPQLMVEWNGLYIDLSHLF